MTPQLRTKMDDDETMTMNDKSDSRLADATPEEVNHIEHFGDEFTERSLEFNELNSNSSSNSSKSDENEIADEKKEDECDTTNHFEQEKDMIELEDVDDDDDDENSQDDNADAVDDDDNDEEDDDDDDGTASVTSDATANTSDLLERAQDRLQLQQLRDKVETLEDFLKKKNAEIEHLTGQLRQMKFNASQSSAFNISMSSVTNGLSSVAGLSPVKEKSVRNLHHPSNLGGASEHDEVQKLKKQNLTLVESQSIMEKDLLNEIMKLSQQLRDQDTKHMKQLKDRDRKLAEKSAEIAKLKEDLRRATGN